MTKTILLADDSSNIHKVVELTFLGEEFRLESVLRGDEALERFSELSPDIVVADVHMPGASGYDVCRQVKKSSPDTPVLLMVGALESFDEEELSACGADSYLKKPFDSELLLQEVQRLTADSDSAAKDDRPTVEAEPETSHAALDSPRVEIGGQDPFHLEHRAAVASVGQSDSPAEEAPTASVLPEQAVEEIAQRVIERLSEDAVREIAWELVPDLAEVVIRDRLQELESELE